MKIGFIGGGNMASALIKGMAAHGIQDIMVSEPDAEKRKSLESVYRVRAINDNRGLVKESDIIVLAVKPQAMEAVLDEIKGDVKSQTVVSIAAGITIGFLGSKLGTSNIVRAMPNAGAFVGEGMTALSMCDCIEDNRIRPVRDIFLSVGRVITLPEKSINAVTAVSGSGPAFIALFLESMIEAGTKHGLSNDHARELGVQTARGTAALLDTGISPRKLREMVTSPGGTTEAGLKVFTEKGLSDTVIEALSAAVRRAGELAK